MTEPSGDTPAARYVGVGIGTYKEKQYPSLPGAPTEVRQIAELLAARGVRTTVAAATTETGIMDELDLVLPAQPEPGEGQLVLLWAGHGDQLSDAPVRLAAEDTVKKRAPRLTPQYVASVAVRSGATQVLLIFDTCFSGGGALPVLAGADRWFGEHEGPPGKVWLGVLASAMDWQKARDDLFGERLARLLRDGPSREELRLRWSAHNAGIRGDDLIDALQKEWPDGSPHRPKAAQFGNPWALLPNPRHDPAAPPRVVEHLLLAARGGEPEDETWYFTGRNAVIGRLVSWLGSGRPGLRVVTGPAGCGKSAVLGLLVCLSHPEQRAGLLARGPLGYPDPGADSIHAHVYARGLARDQLVREFDIQLTDAGVLLGDRRGQRGPGELADAAAASATRPVVVIDGLDEAGVEAWPVAEEVLRPLARHALILVGTRELAAPDGGDNLVTRLQPDTTGVVHLLEEADDLADVHDYVIRRLQEVDAPAMDAGQVAGAILALPGGEEEGRFLLARVITAQLRASPVDTGRPGWQQRLSTSVEQAFDWDLDRLPARIRGEDRLPAAGFDLLAALAWAQGGGLPDDIWPLIATAISPQGTRYTRDDAFWALTSAGRYIVEAGEAGHAVYRLSHQRLGQHLRQRARDNGMPDAELRIANTLVGAYEEVLTSGVLLAEHAYLRRYTWRHCADAGTAGIAALHRLVDLDRVTFLPDLALASRYLARRQGEARKPFDAIGPAEDAVAAYRELAADDPVFLPDLAGAVGNLGVYYREVGRRGDAVPPAEEAVTLFRELAAANPAYLPDLAAALTNLGNHYGEVGRRADAISPAEEAVTLYRELAATNPAYRPSLATALNHLGIRYREVGRRADAIPPAEEAVTLYRDQAATNPAYLSGLAIALTNLKKHQQDASLPWNADIAWSTALDAMPTPDLKAGLLLEKARRATPPQAIVDILAALSLTPPPAGRTLFSLHTACRQLRTSDQDLFDRLWDERVKTGQPKWLLLDNVTLTTTTEWFDTPTAVQMRDYHRGHADILARPDARTALDELALAGIDPDLIGLNRQVLATAAEQGIDDAYRPFVVAESLSAWLDAAVPGKQQLLREDRETLLSSEAAQLVSQWSAENPDDTMLRFGAALLSLTRDGLDPEVFAALDDPGQLHPLLSGLLAAGKPQQLLAAAELVLCLDLDDQAHANARLHLAIALALTGRAVDAPGHARAAARLDPGSVNRWVGILAPLVPAHPGLAALIQALVTTPPDQADGPSRRDHHPDP